MKKEPEAEGEGEVESEPPKADGEPVPDSINRETVTEVADGEKLE